MPTSPPTCCPCGGRRASGQACPRCGQGGKRAYDRERGSSTQRGYDWQWRKFRRLYLAQHPLCSDCEAAGRAWPATDVHHIRKLKDRPDLKYEEGNLLPLCSTHHDARTEKGE